MVIIEFFLFFLLKLSQKRWQSAYIADKKKDGTALKRIRTSIGMHMKSEEFEKASIECLGYAPNIWELDAMCKSNADISEPWVSETRARDALKCFRTFFCFFLLWEAYFDVCLARFWELLNFSDGTY